MHLQRLLAATVISTVANLVLLPLGPAFAHSGGLNADGCHAGSQPYHCHGSTTPVRATSTMPSRVSGDMNCSDFRTWGEAQYFFENSGAGDPHRLDADNDGIACESLR